MKGLDGLFALLVVLAPAAPASSADFAPYPGAAVDEVATREAREATGMETTIYVTRDTFEKVQAFYRARGKEVPVPPPEGPAKTRSGVMLEECYFIFDGAEDISVSKSWIKIQRPWLGGMRDPLPASPVYLDDIYEGIRDVTVIVK